MWESVDQSNTLKPVYTELVVNGGGAVSSGNPLPVTGGGGGTQYTDGGTPPTHPVGTMPIFNNGGTWAEVSASQGLPVNVVAGSSGNAAASATGSAVPADADYTGLNVSGTLRGQTGVNPSGSIYAAQSDISSVGGSSLALGQALAVASLPVVLTAAQITTLTPPTTVTVQQSTSSNLNAVVYGYDGSTQRAVSTTTGGILFTELTNGTNTASVTSRLSILVEGPTASGSSVAAAPVTIGGDASTSLPTAVSNAQVVNAMYDKFGRAVVISGGTRDIVSPITQLTLTSTTTETTLIGQVASVFLDIVSLVVINTSATATQVDFRDSTGGTIRLSLYVPAGDTRGIALPVPLPQNTVNNNWTAKCGTSVASIIITGTYISNK